MKIFDDRADAEVLGHAIILGITVLGVSMILLYGIPTISGLQDLANVKNTEQAFTVLDSRTSRAALGDAPRQITDFNLAGGYLSVISNSSEASYILLELKNGTTVVYNVTIPMGKIVYRLGDREVAYEGGGVWSKYPAGSVMLSPPEFHYNGITLTLPVINITGNSSIGGKGVASVNIEKSGYVQRIYPSVNYTNPIPKNVTTVNVSVMSQYYDAWEDFFRSIPLSRVYPDSSAKKVTVILETPPMSTNITYGVQASDEIKLKNQAKIDSYNSSSGPYVKSISGNGSIMANNKINLEDPQVNVSGNVLSGGSIDGKGTITKDAYGTPIDTRLTVGGRKYPKVSAVALESTTSLVAGKISLYYPPSNDNLGASCLSGTGNKTLDDSTAGWSSGTCTMSAGDYYLTKIELDKGRKLIFNTDSGSINIAVDTDDVTIDNGENITVIGNNPVKLYFRSSTNNEIEIKNSEINMNPGDNSTRFQIFVSGGKEIQFKGANFTGVLFAPDAKIEVDTTTRVYGAMLGKKFEVDNSQNIHFDESLKNIDTGLGKGTTVMYLHVTRNDLGVSIS